MSYRLHLVSGSIEGTAVFQNGTQPDGGLIYQVDYVDMTHMIVLS